MSLWKLIATGLITGVVGPLFWLGVNVLEGKCRRLLREQIAKRQAGRAAAKLRRAARIGQ